MGRKAVDIKNQRYGRLLPKYRVPNPNPNSKDHSAYWYCVCDCGNEKVVSTSSLRSGNIISCGCYKTEKNINNLVGQKFGELTVIDITQERYIDGSIIWKCKCDCGNIHYVPSGSLTSGFTKSCGKCHVKKIIPGMKFTYLTTLKQLEGYKEETWLCQCECGNTFIAMANRLKAGDNKSCGCLNHKIKDLTGRRFGKLIVNSMADYRGPNNEVLCNCLCDCGNTKIVSSNRLQMGRATSCGCDKTSNGEKKIKELLDTNNISYECQKKFNNCRFPETNREAKFDFYINNSYIIEYDGLLHYRYNKSGWSTKEKYEATQRRDTYKTQYCKNNNIPLIRIPYTHYKDLCIEDLLLETTMFQVV